MWGLCLALLAIAVCNGFAIWYVLSEHTVYDVDTLGYWALVTDLRDNLASNPRSALYWFWIGLRSADYPSFTIAPLLPFMLLGSSRIWFILGIVNIFAIPAIGVFFLLVRRFSALARFPIAYPSRPLKILEPLLILATLLLAPTFWSAILSGMPDVGGLVMIAVVLLITLPSLPDLRWRDESLIGILFFLLTRFRRWYLFWILGYFIARGLILVFLLISQRDWKLFLRRCMKLTLCGGIFSALLFAISGPFILRVIRSDYPVLYSGFQIPNFTWLRAAHTLLSNIGYLTVALAVGGLLFALRHPRLRLPSLFLLLQLIACFIPYARVQYFASNNWYLVLTTFLLFASYFLLELAVRTSYARTVAIGAVALFLFMFLSAISPPLIARTSFLRPLISVHAFSPQVRSDVGEMRRLSWTLYDLTREPKKRVYVLSATYVLNGGMLRLIHLPFPGQPKIADRILGTQDLDTLYGFPSRLFEASFVVVADPIQHMSTPDKSRILILPAERLLTNQGLGRAFRRLPFQFQLIKNVTVSIFERTRKNTRAEAQELSDALRVFYPNSPAITEVSVAPGTLSE